MKHVVHKLIDNASVGPLTGQILVITNVHHIGRRFLEIESNTKIKHMKQAYFFHIGHIQLGHVERQQTANVRGGHAQVDFIILHQPIHCPALSLGLFDHFNKAGGLFFLRKAKEGGFCTMGVYIEQGAGLGHGLVEAVQRIARGNHKYRFAFETSWTPPCVFESQHRLSILIGRYDTTALYRSPDFLPLV